MLLLWISLTASADALSVCSDGTCTHTSLAAAVEDAADGDLIEIEDGIWAESLTIDKSLTLVGLGEDLPLLTPTPGSNEPVIRLEGSGIGITKVSISNLAIYGVGFRPLEISASTVVLDHVVVTSNAVAVDGGGLTLESAELHINNSTFDGNRAVRNGGHIHANNSAITVEETLFVGGRATGDGGALYFTGTSSLLVEDTVFEDNRSYARGGAVSINGPAQIAISESHFQGNRAASGGAIGVIGQYGATNITISRSTLVSNIADDEAGALWVAAAKVAVYDTRLYNNQSISAGAIRALLGSSLTLTRSRFCGNSATLSRGGAVVYDDSFQPHGDLVWENNLFVDNEAASGGGAIFLNVDGLNISNNHFLGGRSGLEEPAFALGSAVHSRGTNIVFHDNLVAHNEGTAFMITQGNASLSYNAWWKNETDRSVGLATSTNEVLEQDPRLKVYTRDGNCDNDTLTHSYFGALRDTGTPSSDPLESDPDGSRRDIGAYGGPNVGGGFFEDADLDGSVNMFDCESGEASVSPLADEVWYDGLDQNCDEESDFDRDGDGFDSAAELEGGTDCNDNDPTVYPGAREFLDEIDQDCDGGLAVDVDGDGFFAGVDDCDDEDPNVYPGALERDGDIVDQDCDGFLDPALLLIPATCSHGGSLGWMGGWVFALLLARRRR